MDGVLEAVFYPIDDLCPLALLSTAKDPARVVFRLDDAHPVPGNENVINLRRSLVGGYG